MKELEYRRGSFNFWESWNRLQAMVVIGTDVVERYFRSRVGHKGVKAARTQYQAWLAVVEAAQWRTPEDVKRSHPKASILGSGRVILNIKANFNIKANDYRLIAQVQYLDGVVMIRFFGTHEEYDQVDADTV